LHHDINDSARCDEIHLNLEKTKITHVKFSTSQ